MTPAATSPSTLSSATDGLRSRGLRRGLVLLADPDGIDDDEVGLGFGVGRDALEVIGVDDAARRAPSSARSSAADLIFRMKSRHSSGFTSVPVAIMSTVTAMRGL